MKQFSIILPVKNGLNYAKTCVQSILSQSYPHYNLIILDNNSDDGTSEWLQELNNPKVSIIRSDVSLGITANWARIKNIPKNEFMTIIGYDDAFHDNYLERMNGLIDAHPNASLYQAHFDYINSIGDIIRRCQPMASQLSDAEFLQEEFLQTLDSMGSGYMMRSKDYDALGGIPENYPNLIFADYELWVKLSGLSYLAVTPEVLFQYRLHNSVSKVTNGEDYAKAYFTYLEFLESYQSNKPEVAKVIQLHGKKFMMDFCQSLAHRILKTPKENRTITVDAFVQKCEEYAARMLKNQTFKPRLKLWISAAIILDKNAASRSAFKLAKNVRDGFKS